MKTKVYCYFESSDGKISQQQGQKSYTGVGVHLYQYIHTFLLAINALGDKPEIFSCVVSVLGNIKSKCVIRLYKIKE